MPRPRDKRPAPIQPESGRAGVNGEQWRVITDRLVKKTGFTLARNFYTLPLRTLTIRPPYRTVPISPPSERSGPMLPGVQKTMVTPKGGIVIFDLSRVLR